MSDNDRYTITIKGPKMAEPVVFEYEHVTLTQERGLRKIYDRGAESFGRPVNLEPNGHQRMRLKAWSGCHDYGTFVASEEVTY